MQRKNAYPHPRGPNLTNRARPEHLRAFCRNFRFRNAAKPLSHAIIVRCDRRPTMAKLTGMTIEALIDLRERVEEALLKRRAELQRHIERIAGPHAVVGGRGAGSALRG